MRSAVAPHGSDRLFWAFLGLSCLIHGLLLAGNFSWLERKPLQVIDLDLLPPAVKKGSEEPPPKGEDMKSLEPVPTTAMPDVKPQPEEKPKPPQPIPEPKPLQRVEVPKKPKKAKAQFAPPQPAPSVSERAAQTEEAPATRPAAVGRPEGQPSSRGVGGTEDPVKLFLAQVRQRIDRSKNYPYAARRRQEQGRVTVRFVIRPDGTVDGLQVVRSSASSLLDEAALKAVKDAAPFPGFPRDILDQPLAVEIGLVFELT